MGRKLLMMVVMLALGTASCGGTTTLSKAELVRRGNEICARRTAAIAVAMKRQSYVAGARRALPAMSKSMSQLIALKPPSSLKAKYDRFIAEERAQLAQLQSALAGRRIRRIDAVPHEHGQLRRAIGLTACI